MNRQSNHPPSILKNIPISVNDRLARLSSSKEIFEAEVGPYQKALDESGYDFKLEYKDMSSSLTSAPSRGRNRSRRITYFNPPFSLNVETNIGKEFLDLIRNFPKNNILSKIVNPNTIKLSYRTSKNIGSEVSRHNGKILESEDNLLPEPRCNCQAALRDNCPMPGYCTVQCVVYRALVSAGDPKYQLPWIYKLTLG